MVISVLSSFRVRGCSGKRIRFWGSGDLQSLGRGDVFKRFVPNRHKVRAPGDFLTTCVFPVGFRISG